MGHLGNPAASTPHLDRLVETDAVSFSQAFCQNPICTPSRCSFMTGWYPHTRGHRSMSFPLQPDEPNLLQQLRLQGYTVWWGGKNDLVTERKGFAASCDYRSWPATHHRNLHVDQSWRKASNGSADYSFFAGQLEKHPGEAVYLDDDWAQVLAAREFLQEASDSRPFCLVLNLQYPHPPYGVEEPYFSRISRSRLPRRIRFADCAGKPRMHGLLREELDLYERPESWWDELRATYYGMCARVDEQAGLLLRTLKDTGLYDETAFFLFSDHGDFTGDYDLVEKAGNLFEDCLTRVPFILKPPASHGRACGTRNALVELIDFPATVYELAGIQPDYSHFGRSLIPLLHGEDSHRDAVFCMGGRLKADRHCAAESFSDAGPDPHHLYYPRLKIQSEDGAAHGKALMCRDRSLKLVSRLYESDELYDLAADPGETRNLIDHPDYASRQEALYKRTRTFLLETSDVVPWKRFPRDVELPPSKSHASKARKRQTDSWKADFHAKTPAPISEKPHAAKV